MEVPLLVNDFLRRAAKLYGDKTAIVDGERRFTYREFQERANQLAHALLALGVAKGDRVCILSPNSHFFLESYYGVTQIGAIIVPLNYRLAAADHEYIINHAGVKVVLVDHEYTARRRWHPPESHRRSSTGSSRRTRAVRPPAGGLGAR